MSFPAEEKHNGLSRRSFLKLGAAVSAAGLIGIGMGRSADLLTASEADRADGNQVVRAHARPRTVMSKSKPIPFSLFWITDTQFLSESNPGLFRQMTDWIVDNWSAQNGKMVVHTGDIVQNGSAQAEWENADAAMSVLLKNDIPYTWCAGNHDDLITGDPTSGWSGDQWTSAFNPSVVSRALGKLDGVHWVDHHHNGMNTAVAFSANHMDFLIINLEWNADPVAAVKWAEGLLKDSRYAEHRVIIAPHAYINEMGSVDDATWGLELSAFVKALTSLMDTYSYRIFLTLNGHFPTDVGYHTPNMAGGRNELMFDRQDSTDGQPTDSVTSPNVTRVGGATVTILTFHPEKNQLHVKTYDAYTGEYRDDPQEQFEFTMFPEAENSGPITGYMIPTPVSVATTP